MSSDNIPRYAPAYVLVFEHGNVPVTRYIAHPKHNHPEHCPIKDGYVALEMVTPYGSRWWGFEHAYINSELRMVCVGFDKRNEIVSAWEIVPERMR